MKIAFLHYHVRHGGITTVISEEWNSIKETNECLLVSGEENHHIAGLDTAVVPEIGYDHGTPFPASPSEIADRIVRAVRTVWPSGCDLIHVHNPLLKKNSQFLDVLKILKERGQRLLLHVHDFAEDGRPYAYFRDSAYPEDCHYAVINSSDYDALRSAGLKEEGLHLIPNAVRPLPQSPLHEEKDLILYPVRGIRRKNIGECLLLSLFLPERLSVGITLAPHAERDQTAYEGFRAIARDAGLKIFWGIGNTQPFDRLIARTRLFITTSVKEGFGFSFLEPWTIGVPVIGRRIDSVVRDFESEGLDLSHLYGTLAIPRVFINQVEFQRRFFESFNQMRWLFGLAPVSWKELEVSFGGDTIDFSLFDEGMQSSFILKAAREESVRERLVEANPWLPDFFGMDWDAAHIEKNRKAVRERYGRESAAKALLSAYEAVLSTEVRQSIDKAALVRRFVSAERFRLVTA